MTEQENTSSKPRVYIAPCGVGLGHATRCVMVANELSRAGWDITFSTYLDGLEYLRRTQWPTLESPPISFRTREDGTIDTKLTATQNGVTVGIWKFIRQLIEETRQILKIDPDVVVSDTRVSTILAGFLLRKPTLLVLNQYSVQMPRYTGHAGPVDKLMLQYARFAWKYGSTLLGFAWGLSTLILVPDYDRPFTISEYNLNIPRRILRKVRMIGPVANKKPGRGPRNHSMTSRPLIFACVSGPSNDRKHLVKMLKDLLQEMPDNVDVVLGCGNPNGQDKPKTNGRITVYEWMSQEDYDRIFAEADVIISRAGHSTVMKALREGKPLVLIPPPNHTEQANNSKRACEIGVAIELDQTSLDESSLKTAVNQALEKGGSWPTHLAIATKTQDGAREIVKLVDGFRSRKGVFGEDAENHEELLQEKVPELMTE